MQKIILLFILYSSVLNTVVCSKDSFEFDNSVPQVNRYHWRDWDYQWAVEACFNMRDGFHSVIDFMNNPTLKESELLNPIQTAEAIQSGQKVGSVTAFEVAEKLRKMATKAINGAEQLRSRKNNAELNELLDDICSMAWLGRYYADKIQAAAELAIYQSNQQKKHKEQAVTLLKDAVSHWVEYKNICEKNYHSQMLARTQKLDWSEILPQVKQDVSIAENF